MKNRYMIVGGALVFIILAALLGIYTTNKLSDVSAISREIRKASEISEAALDFNVENFHTQLEVWEYAYEPNQKRLKAFEMHDKKLDELLADLEKLVETEKNWALQNPNKLAALAIGGEDQINDIVLDLEKVHEDWKNLFASITRARELKDLGYDDINSEHHEEYHDAAEDVNLRMNVNEELFDALEFNKGVDDFVADQKDLVWKLQLEQRLVTSQFSLMFFGLIVALILLNVAIGLTIKAAAKKSKK